MDRQARPTVEKIIALKRLEQPPPGYFRLLPERIIHRIEQGEGQSNFWETLSAAFGIRPVLAYALGLTVCGALTVGIWCAPRMAQSAGIATSGDLWAVESSKIAAADAPPSGERWLGSTNPIMKPRSGESLFMMPEGRAIPVSLYLGN
jgi:hypothetical protein